MHNYKNVSEEALAIDGIETPVEVGQEVELDETVAAPLVEEGKLELVEGEAAA